MNTLRGKQVAWTSFTLYTSIMGYLVRLLKSIRGDKNRKYLPAG